VLDVLDEVGTPEAAADWVAERVARGDRIPGFGHPVFTDCDPRAAILESWCQSQAAEAGRQDREQLADAIELAVWEQQRLPPNLDWAFARLLEHLGFERDLHLPLFVCARLVGWCAHALEQAASGETIRPRARYRGVDRASFEPLWRRMG
jgi:citrate synthase